MILIPAIYCRNRSIRSAAVACSSLARLDAWVDAKKLSANGLIEPHVIACRVRVYDPCCNAFGYCSINCCVAHGGCYSSNAPPAPMMPSAYRAAYRVEVQHYLACLPMGQCIRCLACAWRTHDYVQHGHHFLDALGGDGGILSLLSCSALSRWYLKRLQIL